VRYSSKGLLAAAAALLLAACAGHGMLPSATSVAPPDSTGDTMKTTSLCKAAQGPWVFKGSCGTVTLAKSGGSGSLAAYQGIKVAAVFSSGTQKAGTILLVRDAQPGTDITGKIGTETFPPFTSWGSLNNLKPFLYLKAHNQGGALTFNETPKITITSTSPLPKGKCFLGKMPPPTSGQKWAWFTKEAAPGYIINGALVFSPFAQPQSMLAQGTLYLGVACLPS
jgi:hypothetical protein